MRRRHRIRLSFEQHLLAARRHIADLSKSTKGASHEAAKKIPYKADAGVIRDLNRLSKMALREKYEHEASCHKNMLARARKSGGVVDRRIQEFRGFLLFLGATPSPQHTIDRIDNNDLSYGLANCQWATKKEQARNRSTTRRLTIDGETKSIAEWAVIAGVPAGTIRARLSRPNMSHARAVFGREDVSHDRARLERLLLALGIPDPDRFREAFEAAEAASAGRSIEVKAWLEQQLRKVMGKLRVELRALTSPDDEFARDDDRYDDIDEEDHCPVTEWYSDALARLERELEIRVQLAVYRLFHDQLVLGTNSKWRHQYPTVSKVKSAVFRTRDTHS